jgi:hypothetical protein
MTILIISSTYPVYSATVFYANGAFTQNGIEWCEENKPLYDLLGVKFFEHHNHSIESRVCANLIEDELWNYSGPDRTEKLIERSKYFSQLEISESQIEAEIGVLDPTPVDVPDRMKNEIKNELIQNEEKPKQEENNQESGGCLIATAAYGSEMASQIQFLRELRDNTVLATNSGNAFMSTFNSIYYSFSPTIADWERQSPIFKNLVQTTITPLLTSLSLLNSVEIDSEEEMLGYGIGLIILNVGIYFVIPIVGIIKIKHRIIKRV